MKANCKAYIQLRVDALTWDERSVPRLTCVPPKWDERVSILTQLFRIVNR